MPLAFAANPESWRLGVMWWEMWIGPSSQPSVLKWQRMLMLISSSVVVCRAVEAPRPGPADPRSLGGPGEEPLGAAAVGELPPGGQRLPRLGALAAPAQRRAVLDQRSRMLQPGRRAGQPGHRLAQAGDPAVA